MLTLTMYSFIHKQIKGYTIKYIYEKDTLDFLDTIGTSKKEFLNYYDRKAFPTPNELLNQLVDSKKLSPQATTIIKMTNSHFVRLGKRTNAFPRMDFMLGLADMHAKETGAKTHIVELDISNCGGSGDILKTKRIKKIFRLANQILIQSLKGEGASFAFAFDSAKNDDFKILTGGLDQEAINRAMVAAQNKLDDLFMFGFDIPHSKYPNQYGLGVGFGSCKLGQGMSVDKIEASLYQQVEDSKDISFAKRKKYLANNPNRKPLSAETMQYIADKTFERELVERDHSYILEIPFLENGECSSNNPADMRFMKLMKLAKQHNFTERDTEEFKRFVSFYNQPDGLTGAFNDIFLISDIRMICGIKQAAVGLINIKLENCAGVNKYISRTHSVAMTKRFVKTVEEFLQTDPIGKDSSGVYYVGRNSFNILFPTGVSDKEAQELQNRLVAHTDREINDKSIDEYFNALGIPLPKDFTDGKKKMKEISNTRGNKDGIQVLNHANINAMDGFTDQELMDFQEEATLQKPSKSALFR